jgi:hypothetical protein
LAANCTEAKSAPWFALPDVPTGYLRWLWDRSGIPLGDDLGGAIEVELSRRR